MERARLNKEAVNALVSAYGQRKEEFNGVVNNLKLAMYDLTGTWTGEAANAFRGKADDLFANLLTIQNDVENACNKLKLAMGIYEAAEAGIEAAINALERGAADYV